MDFLSNFSDYEFPLNKLTLLTTALPMNGIGSLGLIILNEQFIAYPKYYLTHSTLAQQVAQQWIGNIVSIKNKREQCLLASCFIISSNFANP